MPKNKILFCWEYGAGLGHISSLHIIARELKTLDAECILITPDTLRLPGEYPFFDEILSFPAAASLLKHEATASSGIVSFNATVNEFGYGNPKYLFTRLKLWEQLFESRKPDIVIGDYAPAALMAARKCGIPTIATGNGYTLPPTNIPRYPRFIDQTDPVNGNRLLQSINQALGFAGMEKLGALPEIFKSDIHACFSNALLDPFRKIREPQAIGALLGSKPPKWTGQKSERVFVYLTHCKPHVTSLVFEALAKCNIGADLFSLNAGDDSTASAPNINILERPIPLADICSKYRLAVHLGGHNLMMELLEAGMPQLLLPIDVEKILYAQGMANNGFSHQLRLDNPKSVELLEKALNTAIMDTKLIDTLGHYHDQRQGMNYRASLDIVHRSVEQLL